MSQAQVLERIGVGFIDMHVGDYRKAERFEGFSRQAESHQQHDGQRYHNTEGKKSLHCSCLFGFVVG